MKRRTPKRMTKVQQLESQIKVQEDIIECMRGNERTAKTERKDLQDTITRRGVEIEDTKAKAASQIGYLKSEINFLRDVVLRLTNGDRR